MVTSQTVLNIYIFYPVNFNITLNLQHLLAGKDRRQRKLYITLDDHY